MKTSRLWLPALVIILVCGLGACSDDDDPVAPVPLGTDPELVPGTWDLSAIKSQSSAGTYNVPASEIAADPLVYILEADGGGTTIYKGSSTQFNWAVDGSTLTVHDNGSSQSYTFGVSKTTLRLEFDVEDDVTYHITQSFTRRTGKR